MKIAVINIASVNGGGLAILKELNNYSITHTSNIWYFVVACSGLIENEKVHVIEVSNGALTKSKRIYYECIGLNKILNLIKPDKILSMQNKNIKYYKAEQYIYMQQSIAFQKEYKFSFFKRNEFDCALRQYIDGFFIKRSLNRATKVFVQTEWICDALKPYMKMPDNIIKIGYNESSIVNANMKKNICKNFFYPAGPIFYKNYKVISEAIKLFQNESTVEFKIYLTITKEEFLALGGIVNERSPYIFLGRISFEKVCDLYQSCNLLFASYIETLGLPLLEAKTYGCYIISSDCSFSREVLEDYPNKLLFNPFRPQELKECLKKVLTDEVNLLEYKRVISIKKNCWDTVLDEMNLNT